MGGRIPPSLYPLVLHAYTYVTNYDSFSSRLSSRTWNSVPALADHWSRSSVHLSIPHSGRGLFPRSFDLDSQLHNNLDFPYHFFPWVVSRKLRLSVTEGLAYMCYRKHNVHTLEMYGYGMWCLPAKYLAPNPWSSAWPSVKSNVDSRSFSRSMTYHKYKSSQLTSKTPVPERK